MAVWVCAQCGYQKEARCKPRKCPECGGAALTKREPPAAAEVAAAASDGRKKRAATSSAGRARAKA
ncbi:RCKP-type rubredoxin-like domain-containing protein [Carboxydichorda subterranea]|uniref:RCKP-type rubredoxin-like domain-containing protein n=1 Tax=Carboxydichorda subterranea TaxID=3109565 RepID=UPI0038574735